MLVPLLCWNPHENWRNRSEHAFLEEVVYANITVWGEGGDDENRAEDDPVELRVVEN